MENPIQKDLKMQKHHSFDEETKDRRRYKKKGLVEEREDVETSQKKYVRNGEREEGDQRRRRKVEEEVSRGGGSQIIENRGEIGSKGGSYRNKYHREKRNRIHNETVGEHQRNNGSEDDHDDMNVNMEHHGSYKQMEGVEGNQTMISHQRNHHIRGKRFHHRNQIKNTDMNNQQKYIHHHHSHPYEGQSDGDENEVYHEEEVNKKRDDKEMSSSQKQSTQYASSSYSRSSMYHQEQHQQLYHPMHHQIPFQYQQNASLPYNQYVMDPYYINQKKQVEKKQYQQRPNQENESEKEGEVQQGKEDKNENDACERKIFVGGLPWQSTEDDIHSYFLLFGDIENISIMRDNITNLPRGFAFVTFKETQSALNALRQPHHQLGDKMIEIKKAIPRHEVSPRNRQKKMFVGGIHPQIGEDELREYFSKFGKVKDVQIVVEKMTKASKGFGFVTFYDIETIKKVEECKEHFLKKKMDVKPAEPQRPFIPKRYFYYPYQDYIFYPQMYPYYMYNPYMPPEYYPYQGGYTDIQKGITNMNLISKEEEEEERYENEEVKRYENEEVKGINEEEEEKRQEDDHIDQ